MTKIAPTGEDNFTSVAPVESGSTRRVSVLRSSIESIGNEVSGLMHFLSTYKFLDARWLMLPMVCSFCFAAIAFYIVYCQFLDAKAIPASVLSGDVKRATKLIRMPESITPCLSHIHSTCVGQYLSASYFIICGMILGWLAWIIARDYSRIRNPSASVDTVLAIRTSTFNQQTDIFSDRQEPQEPASPMPPVSEPPTPTTLGTRTITELVDTVKSVKPTIDKAMVGIKTSWLFKQSRRFAPGSDWFWYRCLYTCATEIILQLIRCFVLEEAYAKTNASQTIWQVGLIMVHVNMFMLVFYHQLEVGYVFVTLLSEIGYLVIRLSAYGSLSMRSGDVLDFFTIAGPFAFCIFEIFEITQFILHERKDVDEDVEKRKMSQRRRKIIASVIAFVVTVASVAVIIMVAHKNSTKQCLVDGTWDQLIEEQEKLLDTPDVFALPWGVECYAWQFNLFLEPACSCAFLFLSALPGMGCGAFDEDPDHTKLEPVWPYIQDTTVLLFNLHPDCPMIDANYEKVSSMTSVRMLYTQGMDSKTLRPEFKKFSNLISFYASFTNLQTVDVDILNAWPKLGSFHCNACPFFDSPDVFAEADLPQLQLIEIYGGSSCPGKLSLPRVQNIDCLSSQTASTGGGFTVIEVDPNAETFCDLLPRWLVAYYVRKVKGATRSGCFEPRCSYAISLFNFYDSDDNGLMSVNNYRMLMTTETGPLKSLFQLYPDEGYHCVFNLIRQGVPFVQDLHNNSTEDGLTILEFTALQTGYTNCRECDATQAILDSAAGAIANRTEVDYDLTPECSAIWKGQSQATLPNITDFRDACDAKVPACHSACPAALQFLQFSDANQDGRITEAEFRSVQFTLGTAHLAPIGIFDCFSSLGGPGCMDGDVSNGLSMDVAISLGLWFANFPASTCSDCVQ